LTLGAAPAAQNAETSRLDLGVYPQPAVRIGVDVASGENGRVSRSHPARVARHGAVSTALALLSDRRLGELVEAAPLIGSGIGGTSVSLEIEGWPVFVKRVPLTDL
jgi:hypothetical protein